MENNAKSTKEFQEERLLIIFEKTINICREALTKTKPKEEPTYEYAVIRFYSRMLVTSCAIHTLLKEGYPDDAMGLCRKLYEGLVIINTLIKAKKSGDENLPNHFIDAPQIMALKNDFNTLSLAIGYNPNDSVANTRMDFTKKRIQPFLEKYQKKEINDFSDYWWLNYGSFGEMAKHSDFEKHYIYALLCNKTHMNALDAFHYLDNSEPGILIGATEGGKKLPLWYASLFLYYTSKIIHDYDPTICPQNVFEQMYEFYEETSIYLKQ